MTCLNPPRQYLPGQRAQRGAIAIMVACTIFVILGVCGMAIDLGMMYNRRVEMQNLADAAALAAAAELDGTTTGVTRAMTSAATVAASFQYSYKEAVTWSPDALKFGTSGARSGTWIAAGAAQAAPDGQLFARVDTTQLTGTPGMVRTLFMNALGSSRDGVVQGAAIAGRTGVKALPLAICALSTTPAEGRATASTAGSELVEFGFRRGISYNLMDLNPHGSTAAHFAINPFAPPGKTGTSGPTSPAIIGPYVCSGTMSMARVKGTLTVAANFPLASVVDRLNSRFGKDNNACNPMLAPPDTNIKEYTYKATANPDGTTTAAGVTWMTTPPLGQSATIPEGSSKRITVADASPTPTGTSAAMFGPLWSYARAVPWSRYAAGQPEPSAGYTSFPVDDWPKLYDPGKPTPKSYPGPTPYQGTEGTYASPTSIVRPQRNRRVLNGPLLECPVTGVTARAVGVGKFFMTVPATGTAIFAEFAGTVSDQALGAATVLFP